MAPSDRRQHKRLGLHFQTLVNAPTFELPIEGVTENLSQGGAFIKISDWRTFQINDSASLTFLLPPSFSGQDETIGLKGKAVIRRVDRDKVGIGVEFDRSFRQFTPTKGSDIGVQ